MTTIASASDLLQEEVELISPTTNDVIIGQSLRLQEQCPSFRYHIKNYARVFTSSFALRSGILSTVAERLKFYKVRFLAFRAGDSGSYGIVTDDAAIGAEIKAAFAKYIKREDYLEAQHRIEVLSNANAAAAQHRAMERSSPAAGVVAVAGATITRQSDGIIDLTEEESPPRSPTPDAANITNTREGSGNQSQLYASQLRAIALRSPIRSGWNVGQQQQQQQQQADEITRREVQSLRNLEARQALRDMMQAQQASGEGTGQNTGSVESQQLNASTPPREQPEMPGAHQPHLPLHLPAISTALPASHATTYAAHFKPVDIAGLPIKTYLDMTGWQFFPMNLKQNLRDVSLLNEWKIVVVPMATSLGEPFVMAP